MHALYTVLLAAALVLAGPYFLLRRLVDRKSVAGLRQRLGWELPPAATRPSRWVHAVSVGEILMMAPLLDRWVSDASRPLYLSTTTSTGQALATRKYGDRACVFYFPIDLPWIVGRFLERIAPAVVIIAETELWPNLFRQSRAAGIPVVLVNGRLSDHSFRQYRKIKFFMRRVLADLALCAMQSETAAERIRQLGAPAARVVVTGNLKFDVGSPPGASPATGLVASALALDRSRLLVVGSSMPGEEPLLLDVFSTLKRKYSDFRMLLAPRHQERFETVARLLDNGGWRVARRTQLTSAGAAAPCDILLLDTLGELSQLYALAGAVFVGGTLVPTGGHNPIEPARHGKLIFFGPYMENFAELAEALLAAQAAVQVRDAASLHNEIDRWLSSPDLYRHYGDNARLLVENNAGAAARTLAAIERLEPGPATQVRHAR